MSVSVKSGKDISANWKTFLSLNKTNSLKPVKPQQCKRKSTNDSETSFIDRKKFKSKNINEDKVEFVKTNVENLSSKLGAKSNEKKSKEISNKLTKGKPKIRKQDECLEKKNVIAKHSSDKLNNKDGSNLNENHKSSVKSSKKNNNDPVNALLEEDENLDDKKLEEHRAYECFEFFTDKKNVNLMPVIPNAGDREEDGRYPEYFWSSYLPLNKKLKYKVISYPVKYIASVDPGILKHPKAVGANGVRPKLNLDRPFVGLDCEMVGTIGGQSILARVSLVNDKMQCIYDTFVKPIAPVTDYRTRFSGVRKQDMETGADFKIVQKIVATLIYNRILVGHALSNDLSVLGLKYPMKYTRDTAKYKALRNPSKPKNPLKLSRLTKNILNEEIQTGEHSSIVDAKSALAIYLKMQDKWETKKKLDS